MDSGFQVVKFGFGAQDSGIPKQNFSGFPYMGRIKCFVVKTINKRVHLTGNDLPHDRVILFKIQNKSQKRHQFPACKNLSQKRGDRDHTVMISSKFPKQLYLTNH